ncbi:MAG: hypothetical protein IKI45_07410 [Oscillospiraceae bacterium]|nr:hypothetical protein [Oscillospiraceae bacterium]
MSSRTFPLSSLGCSLALAPRAQRNLTFGQKIKNKQTNKKQLRPVKINIRTKDKGQENYNRTIRAQWNLTFERKIKNKQTKPNHSPKN